ncbi:MAG: hypothetical protein JWN60_1330 [Acidobacteria bacterium]|nr:hypothetical protein [Acidobacteriota bacterium]
MAELEIRESAIDPSNCISEGWALIKPNYGLFLGMSVIMIVITIVVGLIPYIGDLINVFLTGPLLCGVYIALLAKMRSDEPNFAMFFEGFSRFLPAMLITLIPLIPWLILALFAYLFVSFGSDQAADAAALQGLESIFGILTPVLIVSYIGAFLVSLALQILLFFALPLVAEHNLNTVDAVKLSLSGAASNFGGIIVLLIFETLIALLGVIALCIGIFFVLPVIYAANIIAYRSVFPAERQTRFDGPPQPDSYDTNYGIPQQ